MRSPADKDQSSQLHAATHKQKSQGNGGSGLEITDNRPATAQLKNQQQILDNHASSSRLGSSHGVRNSQSASASKSMVQRKPPKSKHNRKNLSLAKHLGLHAGGFADSASVNNVLAEAQPEEELEAEEAQEEALEESSTAERIEQVKAAAHGVGVDTSKAITEAQITYQGLLAQEMTMGDIMDSHRSVGFEYEFATYEKIDPALALDSHTELGTSASLSPLFKLPFKLETDAQNELEIVTPPLLIANGGKAIDKGAAKRLYNVYKTSASDLRDKSKNQVVSTLKLPDEGFGHTWKFGSIANNLKVSSSRDKHQDSDKQVYSQMNISLTPGETADFIDSKSLDKAVDQDAEILTGTDIFSKVYFQIVELLDDEDGIEEAIESYLEIADPEAELAEDEEGKLIEDTKDHVFQGTVLISNALASSASIPSIVINQSYRQYELVDSLHSQVKETFGIWVKDTIQNVLSSLTNDDAATRHVLKSLLETHAGSIPDLIESEILTDGNNAFPKIDEMSGEDFEEMERLQAMNVKIEKDHIKLSDLAKKEVQGALAYLTDLLNEEDIPPFDFDTEFLSESFEGTQRGFGARKDTFVPIDSGKKTRLHLAEIRNDESIGGFLDE